MPPPVEMSTASTPGVGDEPDEDLIDDELIPISASAPTKAHRYRLARRPQRPGQQLDARGTDPVVAQMAGVPGNT